MIFFFEEQNTSTYDSLAIQKLWKNLFHHMKIYRLFQYFELSYILYTTTRVRFSIFKR